MYLETGLTDDYFSVGLLLGPEASPDHMNVLIPHTFCLVLEIFSHIVDCRKPFDMYLETCLTDYYFSVRLLLGPEASPDHRNVLIPHTFS